MRNCLKGFIKLVVILILFVCASITVVLYLAIDDVAHVQSVELLDTSSAKQAKQSVSRIYHSLKASQNNAQLVISNKELNGLLSLAHRAIPSLKVQCNLINDVAQLTFSQKLPFGERYANVSTFIYSSKQGIALGDTSIGSLSFSGNWLLSIVEWGLNQYLENDFASELLATVKSIIIKPNSVVLSYQLPNGLADDGDGLSVLMQLRDQWALFGNVKDVQFYFDKLVGFSMSQNSTQLVDYINYVLNLAKDNTLDKQMLAESEPFENSGLAKQENYAALMALVLYFGHDKFELLVGNIINLSDIDKLRRYNLQSSVELGQRVDLQKHFIYSIALQLFSNLSASDAIGEFKELIDANKGGSGFSFADLLADKAGTRFAKLATSEEAKANKLQHFFTTPVVENDFMPTHLNLPEGISEQDFSRLYRNINSKQYQAMLNTIEQRLVALPIYQ